MTELHSKEWRPIPGFPGYRISSDGRVRSDHSKYGKVGLLRPKRTQSGYHRVSLFRDGKMHSFAVHRLVLLVFVGPPPSPDSVTRHLNGKRLDNRVENLAWGTVQDNHDDMVAHGTFPGHPRLTVEQVKQIIQRHSTTGESQASLGREFGVTYQTIQAILGGRKWAKRLSLQ